MQELCQVWVVPRTKNELHNLVLCKSGVRIGFHAVAAARLVQIFDEAQVQWSSTILVALELCDCRLGGVNRVKTDNTAASRSAAGFILNLSLLDLANGGEQFNQVIVAS